MGGFRSGVSARPAMACLALGLLLGGCAGDKALSESVTTLNREVATLQDQQVLLNVRRRSWGQPAHFTSLSLVRGRNRASGGASLRVPSGADALSRFVFEPSFSTETGPAIELAPLNSQEFFRGPLTPVGTAALAPHLRRWRSAAVILAVVIGEIRLGMGAGAEIFANDPDDPAAFAAFQRALRGLVDRGLTTEPVDLVRDVGPPFGGTTTPAAEDILAAEKEGLAVEDTGARGTAGGQRRVQMRRLIPSVRFCFAAPRTALAWAARCGAEGGPGARARVGLGSRRAFGAPGRRRGDLQRRRGRADRDHAAAAGGGARLPRRARPGAAGGSAERPGASPARAGRAATVPRRGGTAAGGSGHRRRRAGGGAACDPGRPRGRLLGRGVLLHGATRRPGPVRSRPAGVECPSSGTELRPSRGRPAAGGGARQ